MYKRGKERGQICPEVYDTVGVTACQLARALFEKDQHVLKICKY